MEITVRPHIVRGMAAGLAATVIMTGLLYLASLLGMPGGEFVTPLSGLLATSPDSAHGQLILTLWHLNFGAIIFPHIYCYFAYQMLPGSKWAKGALFGAGIWLFTEIFVMPMLRLGIFSRLAPHPFVSVVGLLVANLVYGLVLGGIAGHAQDIVIEKEIGTETHAAA